MAKFSASLLLLIFVCYFSITTARIVYIRPKECHRQLPFAMAICQGEKRTYCVIDLWGKTMEVSKSYDCPPCESYIMGYYVGKCQTQTK